MNIHRGGYKCPACGHAATTVVQTSNLSNCVVRKRKCVFCGQIHETCEFPMDIGDAMLEAVNVLTENAMRKTGAAAH